MTRHITFAALLVAVALLAGSALAAETARNPVAGQDAISIPRLIHYQGKLTDLGGIPITGNRNMVFRLYAGVSQFWTESRTVSVNQGIFNVLLGSVNPVATIPESDPCSLEILVEGAPIVPKVRLVSVPFAYNANKTHDIDDGMVTNPKLALNAVTSDKIMDGGVQTTDLAPNAVTTDKILDGGIQAADLASGSVTNVKLSVNAVTTDKVLDGTVADLDLSASGVTAGTYSLATVTVNNKGRITSASSGSVGAGVTRVDQGVGIVLGPNPIVSTGSVRLDTVYSDNRYIRNQSFFAQNANFWIGGAGRAVQFNAASTTTGYPAMLADGATFSYGLAATNNHATNMAVYARNTAGVGTGLIASGNNMTPYYHVRGTGGCFTGKFAGAMGVTDDVTGFGVAGVSVNLQGTGVGGAGNDFDTIYSPTGGAGGAFRGNAAGVYGRTDSASGYGVMGFNYNLRGSAVVGLANRMSTVHQVNGGVGGSFNGRGAGAIGWSDSTAGFGLLGLTAGSAATGVVGAGNGRSMYLIPGGSGGAFTGRQYGIYAIAETTGGTRAGGVFSYNGGGNVAVALNDNGTLYKINGPGTVNTVMATREGKKSLFCPEMPEAWFEDVGAGRLVRGHCRIDLAPLFTDCIVASDNCPLKVFVQLEDDCNGVFVRTDALGFDVYELRQGVSDSRFSYRVLGKWKGYENLRFPDAPRLPEGVPAAAVETRPVNAVPVNSAPQPAPNDIKR